MTEQIKNQLEELEIQKIETVNLLKAAAHEFLEAKEKRLAYKNRLIEINESINYWKQQEG